VSWEKVSWGKKVVGKWLSSHSEALFFTFFYIFSLIKSLLAVMAPCKNVMWEFVLIIDTLWPCTNDSSLLPCQAFFRRFFSQKINSKNGKITELDFPCIRKGAKSQKG